MYRTFKLLTIVAVLSLAVWAGRAEAVLAHRFSAADFTGSLTVTAGSLATGRPAADATFTGSSAVRTAYHASNTTGNFTVVAQHQRGNLQYVMHNSGGAVFAAPATAPTWVTLADTFDPDATTGLNTAYKAQ